MTKLDFRRGQERTLGRIAQLGARAFHLDLDEEGDGVADLDRADHGDVRLDDPRFLHPPDAP